MWKRGPQTRRINLVGILAAVLALVSLGLSWWGIDIAPSGAASLSWGLASSSPPGGGRQVFFVFDQLNSGFSSYYQLMILLVLVTSILAGLGSFLKNRIILALGLILSVLTALIFLVDVNGAVSQACVGLSAPGDCISGLSGSGTRTNWGFQSGYYLFLLSTLVLAVSLVLHRSTISLRLTREPID